MIQATFTGNITGIARYRPATRDSEALVSFSCFVGPLHLQEHDYMRCRLRGRQAERLHHYLVSGKRVLCSGLVRMVTDVERPFLGCNVTTIELLGGGSHPLPHEVTAFDEDRDEHV